MSNEDLPPPQPSSGPRRARRHEESVLGRVSLKLRRPLRNVSFRVLQDIPGSSAKFFALEQNRETFVLPMPADGGKGDSQPVPPRHLWLGYGDSAAQYLESGRGNLSEMLAIIAESGWTLEPQHRVLDFGCGAGRMTRWIPPRLDGGETWGVDISAACIQWAKEHLTPPARFCTTTTFPHLPFGDGYFDLILAGSVFTSMTDLEDAWLLELRRVLRPGGRVCLSLLDKHALSLVREAARHGELGADLGIFMEAPDVRPLAESNFAELIVHRSLKGGLVIRDIDYVTRMWGQFFDVMVVRPEGHAYETVLVMSR